MAKTNNESKKVTPRFGKKVVSNAPFAHFDEPGEELVAVLVSIAYNVPSKINNSPPQDVGTFLLLEPVKVKIKKEIKIWPSGEHVQYPIRAGMKEVSNLKLGSKVQIIYGGKVELEAGKTAHNFEVYAEEPPEVQSESE
jgi:hypothetical protein